MYDNMYQFISCEYPDTPVYDVSRVSLTGLTLIGNQEKWYLKEEGLIIKAPFLTSSCYWTDYLVECIASSLGKQLGFDVVDQHLCWIVDGNRKILGTASKSYFEEGMEYQTFYRTMDLPQDHRNFVKDPFAFVLNRYLEIFQGHPETESCAPEDIKKYLLGMVCLDALVGNDDRHLNNFGIGIYQPSGKPFLPPLFDFGLGLFQGAPEHILASVSDAYNSVNLKPWDCPAHNAYSQASKVFDCPLFPEGTPCIDLTGLIMPSFTAERYIRSIASRMNITVKGRPVLPKFSDSWHGVTPVPKCALMGKLTYSTSMHNYQHHDTYQVTLMWRDNRVFTITSKDKKVHVYWEIKSEFCAPPEVLTAYSKSQDIGNLIGSHSLQSLPAEELDVLNNAFDRCYSTLATEQLTSAETLILKRSQIKYCATVGLGNFLKQRLPSLSRHNLQRILSDIGDQYTQPYREVLLAASHGVNIDDEYWILINGEDLTYADVRIR